MKRTPMEMSAYRMARRHRTRHQEPCFSEWLRKNGGPEARGIRKTIALMVKDRVVLGRRIARKGSTVYE